MASIARSFGRVPRARFLPSSIISTQPRRFAHSSYGNEQSGQEQGTHEKNPMSHMEHPGPEAPDTGSSSGSSQSSAPKSSDGSKPKIQGDNASQDQNAEVRQHNKEMEQRADRSANQLNDGDNKVDKKFWKGDVGDMDQQAEKKD